jgi:hypothetical protein
MTTPKFTKEHFEFVADFFGPLMNHPTDIDEAADHLAKTNPNFKKDLFINRAVQAWEARHMDDEASAIQDNQSMIDSKLTTTYFEDEIKWLTKFGR